MPQSIMGIERIIPRVASLTVDCRGVNISLTIKGYWQPKFLLLISIRLTDRILNFAFSCVQHIQLLRKLIEMLFVRPPF